MCARVCMEGEGERQTRRGTALSCCSSVSTGKVPIAVRGLHTRWNLKGKGEATKLEVREQGVSSLSEREQVGKEQHCGIMSH